MQTANGHYHVSFNADAASGPHPAKGAGEVSLGVVEQPLLWRRTTHAVGTQTSAASSLADYRYQGGECRLQLTFKEWTLPLTQLLWPFSSDFGAEGEVGVSLVELAGELTLTAVAGSLAAAAGPATITFGKVSPEPQAEIVIPLGTDGRDIRVTLICFPYEEDGVRRWFTTA